MKPWVRCCVLVFALAALYAGYLLSEPLNGKPLRTVGELCQIAVAIEVMVAAVCAGITAFCYGD